MLVAGQAVLSAPRQRRPRRFCCRARWRTRSCSAQLLQQELGKKVRIRVPQRGDNVRLVELAEQKRRAKRPSASPPRQERAAAARCGCWQSMLGLARAAAPAGDPMISPTSPGTDIVASMVVFADGTAAQKRTTSALRSRIWPDQDDYASMRQVLQRRLTHYVAAATRALPSARTCCSSTAASSMRAVAEDVLQDARAVDPDLRHGQGRPPPHPRARDRRRAGDRHQRQFRLCLPSSARIQEETHRFAIDVPAHAALAAA